MRILQMICFVMLALGISIGNAAHLVIDVQNKDFAKVSLEDVDKQGLKNLFPAYANMMKKVRGWKTFTYTLTKTVQLDGQTTLHDLAENICVYNMNVHFPNTKHFYCKVDVAGLAYGTGINKAKAFFSDANVVVHK